MLGTELLDLVHLVAAGVLVLVEDCVRVNQSRSSAHRRESHPAIDNPNAANCTTVVVSFIVLLKARRELRRSNQHQIKETLFERDVKVMILATSFA